MCFVLAETTCKAFEQKTLKEITNVAFYKELLQLITIISLMV
jgi:hypothetical protein